MAKIVVHGKENIVTPGFYMPNRFSVEAAKALHRLLGDKVCYLVDPSFEPEEELMKFIKASKAEIEYFDFRNTTSLAVREQIRTRMADGVSVVFLPGKVAKIRGTYCDIPSPFLRHVGSLHISPIPLYLGYYGETVNTLFREVPDVDTHEEFCILPKLASGPQTGERLMAAWLQKSAELFAAQPMLEGSLTSALVRAMKANPKVEIVDGLTGNTLPFFKALGVSMAVAKKLRKRDDKIGRAHV